MYLLLNTYAGGGSANRKWDQIKALILNKYKDVKVANLNSDDTITSILKIPKQEEEKSKITRQVKIS